MNEVITYHGYLSLFIAKYAQKNRLCNPVNGGKLHSFRLDIDIAHINYF
jgi:hypothetical protein